MKARFTISNSNFRMVPDLKPVGWQMPSFPRLIRQTCVYIMNDKSESLIPGLQHAERPLTLRMSSKETQWDNSSHGTMQRTSF